MLTNAHEGQRVREIATKKEGVIDTVYTPYRGCGNPECCGLDGPGSVEVTFDDGSYESFSTGYDGDDCDELEAVEN